jgi:hypothetical protein
VETAKQAGRTGFGDMIALLKKSQACRTVLVEKTDRLYRNLKDWVTIDGLGLEVHFGLAYRKSGNPVPTSTVHKILRKRAYTGDYDYNGVTYHGNYEPIVSMELWEQVQDVLGYLHDALPERGARVHRVRTRSRQRRRDHERLSRQGQPHDRQRALRVHAADGAALIRLGGLDGGHDR